MRNILLLYMAMLASVFALQAADAAEQPIHIDDEGSLESDKQLVISASVDAPVCHVSYDGTVIENCMQLREEQSALPTDELFVESLLQPAELILPDPEKPYGQQNMPESEFELQVPELPVIEEKFEPAVLDSIETINIEPEQELAPEPVPEAEVVVEDVAPDCMENSPVMAASRVTTKRTPLEERLLWAAANGKSTAVKYALKNPRVNVNITDDDGRTPLMLGVLSGRSGVVKVILGNNPDLAIVSNAQETALSIARGNGATKIEKLLLKAGAQE